MTDLDQSKRSSVSDFTDACKILGDPKPKDTEEVVSVSPNGAAEPAAEPQQVAENGTAPPGAGDAWEPGCGIPVPVSALVDAEGHPVPESCAAAFLATPKFEEADALARSLQKQIHGLSSGPGGDQLRRCLKPTGTEEKLVNKSEHLNALKRDLKFTRPYCVCPYCRGAALDGCKGCSGTGWVTKLTWDNTDQEMKERL